MAGEAFTHLRIFCTTVVPDLILARWQDLAKEHVATGFYASFLAFSWLYPYEGNLLASAVANSAPYAAVLEEGHAGFHLPEKVDWSGAEGRGTARRTKDGRRYLIIPFRHYTKPGTAAGGITSRRARATMPADVETLAKQLGDARKRRQAQAALAARGPWMSKAYSLPGVPTALRDRALAQEGMPGYTWRASQYEGLHKYEQRNAAGRVTGSTYMTFRALVEDSVGWYIPPQPGFHFARRTAEAVREDLQTGPVRAALAEAARADVVELVQARVG